MVKYHLYCPKCKKNYAGEEKYDSCAQCSAPLIYTERSIVEWRSLSSEEKEKVYADIEKGYYFVPERNDENQKTSSYGWINLYDGILNLFIAVGVIASVLIATAIYDSMRGAEPIAWAIGIGGTLLTLVSVGGLKISIGIARDVRDINNKK